MVSLSKRLKAIYDLVDCDRICDVGCDHGKLVASLFQNKKVKFSIISDISEKCVLKANNLLTKLDISNFEMRIGDGLSVLNKNDRIEQVIISGMGGNEILNILKKSEIKVNSLVLQPQNHILDVKKYLIDNNYLIVNNFILRDDKFYEVIKAKYVDYDINISDFDLIYGEDNFKIGCYFNDFKEYLLYQKNKFDFLLKNADNKKIIDINKMIMYNGMAIEKLRGVMYEKDT